MYTKTKSQQRADARQVRKFNKLLKQIPSCLNNHHPSVMSWLEGELTLTAATSYDMSAVKSIFESLKGNK